MKKLNLQLGSIKEMLTKEQMKKVSGGYLFIDCQCVDVNTGRIVEEELIGPDCDIHHAQCIQDCIDFCAPYAVG